MLAAAVPAGLVGFSLGTPAHADPAIGNCYRNNRATDNEPVRKTGRVIYSKYLGIQTATGIHYYYLFTYDFNRPSRNKPGERILIDQAGGAYVYYYYSRSYEQNLIRLITDSKFFRTEDLPRGGQYHHGSHPENYGRRSLTRVPCPGEEKEEEVGLVLSKKTLRLSDPINEVPFDDIVEGLGEAVTGEIFKRASKKVPVTDEARRLEAFEKDVEAIEYKIEEAALRAETSRSLLRGDVRGVVLSKMQPYIDRVNKVISLANQYTEVYTVKLSAEPEETVTVRISSDHPDAFKFTSDSLTLFSTQTLTFTPENWNEPQEVRVRVAFTASNYLDAELPTLATLTHTASSGETATVQVGVLDVMPISDHLYNALISYLPKVQESIYKALCSLNPVCRAFFVGEAIGGKLSKVGDWAAKEYYKGQARAEQRRQADFMKDRVAKSRLSPQEKRDFRDAINEGGPEGGANWAHENLGRSRANPSHSVSTKSREAVQLRIGARSGIEVTTTVPDSSPLLNRVLERSAEYLLAHQSAINGGQFHFDLQDAMAVLGSDFNLPLSALNLAKAEGAAEDGFSRNFALWGSVDYGKFGDSADNFSVDGHNWTFTVGVDGQVTPSLLAGVALSRSTAESEYDYIDSVMTGDYDLDLTVVTPYVNWSATDNLGIWASVGYGKGNSTFSLNTLGILDLTAIDAINQESLRQKQKSDYFSFAGGLRWEAFRSERSQLALKLAGATTSFMEADSQQGRLAVEISRAFPAQRGVFSTSMDLALLVGNDADAATEVVGGLDWASANGKLTASTVARTLLFSGERYEWGLGAALNYKAGVRPGEGLSLSLEPSIGNTASELTHLDILSTTEEAARLAFQPWQPSAHLSAQLDYGIATGHGLLTPYTEISLSESSTVTSAGLRYKLRSTPLDLDLKGTRRQRHAGDNDHSVLLQLRTQF